MMYDKAIKLYPINDEIYIHKGMHIHNNKKLLYLKKI